MMGRIFGKKTKKSGTAAVLVIGPRPEDGGFGTGVAMGFESLVQGLCERQIHFHCVDANTSSGATVFGRFSLIRALKKLRVVLNVWRCLPHAETVYMTVSSSGWGFLRDFLIIWPAWMLGKRIILHLKGGGYKNFFEGQFWIYQKIIERTLRNATTIIVLGNLLKNQFDFVKAYEEKVQVVPNGLTFGISAETSPKRASVGAENPFRILYLSNLIPSKGYEDLLDALAILKERGVTFRCDFCGDFLQIRSEEGMWSHTDLRDNFYQKVARMGLDNQVVHHGTVDGDEKQQLLENAHVFVLPTYYPWEGQPLSIIEAFAFGVPVISTPHKGIPEQVIDGYNGYLIEPKSPEQIADKLRELQTCPETWNTLSKNAKNYYKKKFTRDAHLSKLIPLLLQESGGDVRQQ